MQTSSNKWSLVALGVLGACAVAACSQTDPIGRRGARQNGPTDGESGQQPGGGELPVVEGIRVPDGFVVEVAGQHLSAARDVAQLPNGDIVVANHAGVVVLWNTDDDPELEGRRQLIMGPYDQVEATDDAIYVSRQDAVLRMRLPLADDRSLMEAPEVVVSGLPASGDHPEKILALSEDGALLYVGISAATPLCESETPRGSDGAAEPPTDGGSLECDELSTRAGVWRFDAAGTNMTQADGRRFATGIGVVQAMTVDRSEQLWVAAMGRDIAFPTTPATAPNPLGLDAITQVRDGDNLGWPFCYVNDEGRLTGDPVFGGAAVSCADFDAPSIALPARSQPFGMTFYNAEAFPERYRGGMFVALHGPDGGVATAAPGSTPADDRLGYSIGFIQMEQVDADGCPQPVTGEVELFASGFATLGLTQDEIDRITEDGRIDPAAAVHRPAGLAVGRDGQLWVVDDQSGFLLQIQFVGADRKSGDSKGGDRKGAGH